MLTYYKSGRVKTLVLDGKIVEFRDDNGDIIVSRKFFKNGKEFLSSGTYPYVVSLPLTIGGYVELLAEEGERTWIYRDGPFVQTGEWMVSIKGELMYRFENSWYYSLHSLVVRGFGKRSGGGDSHRLLIGVGESRMSIAKIKHDHDEWKATNRAPEFIRERTISRALTNANRTLIERVDIIEARCKTFRKDNRQLRKENQKLIEKNKLVLEENERLHEKTQLALQRLDDMEVKLLSLMVGSTTVGV
jgi:hypothetical protein